MHLITFARFCFSLIFLFLSCPSFSYLYLIVFLCLFFHLKDNKRRIYFWVKSILEIPFSCLVVLSDGMKALSAFLALQLFLLPHCAFLNKFLYEQYDCTQLSSETTTTPGEREMTQENTLFYHLLCVLFLTRELSFPHLKDPLCLGLRTMLFPLPLCLLV